MAKPTNRGENQKQRTIHIDGKDKCDYLVALLEKAYFDTHDAKQKKFLARLLSDLA